MLATGLIEASSDGAGYEHWISVGVFFEAFGAEAPEGYYPAGHDREGEGARYDYWTRYWYGDDFDEEEWPDDPPPELDPTPYLAFSIPGYQYECHMWPTHPYEDLLDLRSAPVNGMLSNDEAVPKPAGSDGIVAIALGEYPTMAMLRRWIVSVMQLTGYELADADHTARYKGWANWRFWFVNASGEQARVDLFGDFDPEVHEGYAAALCPYTAVAFYGYDGDPRVAPTF
jgi:hypothetical protein